MGVISKLTVDLIPFLLEAFGQKKTIYQDIDRIYRNNRDEYYKLAKNSEYYCHPIIREGTTQQEEYSKKTLGILLCLVKTQSYEIRAGVYGIIKKAWPSVITYLEDNETISIGRYFARRKRYLKTCIDLNTETIILLWLANALGKTIEKDSLFKDIGLVLVERLNLRSKNKFCQQNMESSLLKNTHELKLRIIEKYGKIISLDKIFDIKDKELRKHVDFFEKLYDTEELSINCVFENVKISDKDLDEILGVYFSEFNNKNATDAAGYLISGFIVKGFLKAYKEAKDYYFCRNGDGTPVKPQPYEKVIETVTDERDYYKAQTGELKKHLTKLRKNIDSAYFGKIAEMEKKIRHLRKRLLIEKQKEKELSALRSMMFSLRNEDIPHDAGLQEDCDLRNINVVIAGGYERWQRKIKERYPNFVFITSDNFDTRLLDGTDHVFIFARYIGHSLYYRVINEVRKREISISYISKVNEELAIKEIKSALS